MTQKRRNLGTGAERGEKREKRRERRRREINTWKYFKHENRRR